MLRAQRKRHLLNESEDDQSDVDKRTVTAYLIFAIIATILTIVVLLVILVMRKRIQLVVQLFKEAGKAVASLPILLFEPILVSYFRRRFWRRRHRTLGLHLLLLLLLRVREAFCPWRRPHTAHGTIAGATPKTDFPPL